MNSVKQRDLLKNNARLRVFSAALLLAAITVIVWSSCLQFGFVYDDHAQIEVNPRIQSVRYAGELVSEPLWSQLGASRASQYYRPLFSLLLLAEYEAFGLTASFWHGASLALYVLSVLAVYLLLLLLFDRVLAAFVGSFVFALLPVHTEVVSWVSAVDESQYSVLLMLGLCALIRANRASTSKHAMRWLVLSGSLVALALFSKETAIFAGLILASYQWIVVPRKKGVLRAAWLVYAIPLALYLTARMFSMEGNILSVPRRSLGVVLALLPGLSRLSILQLVGIGPVSSFYDSPASRSTWLVAGTVFLLCLVAAGCVLLRKRAPIVAWALSLFFLPLISWAAALFYLSDDVLFQNRYLFLPSVAIAVMIAYCLRLTGERGRIAITAVICLVLGPFLAFADDRAMMPYRDDLAMFQHAVRIAPKNVTAIELLAEATSKAGDDAAALDLIRRTSQLQPHLWETNFHLAMAYLKGGRKDESEGAFRSSIDAPHGTQAQKALSWFEVGKLRSGREDLAGAMAAFQEAEKLQPSSRRVHQELLVLYTKAGRTTEATMERFKLMQRDSSHDADVIEETGTNLPMVSRRDR